MIALGSKNSIFDIRKFYQGGHFGVGTPGKWGSLGVLGVKQDRGWQKLLWKSMGPESHQPSSWRREVQIRLLENISCFYQVLVMFQTSYPLVLSINHMYEYGCFHLIDVETERERASTCHGSEQKDGMR